MTAALTQLSRIYGHELTTPDAARKTVAAAPETLASALFSEAADSDDVTSIESALEYLAARLAYLGDLVGPNSANQIRTAFQHRLESWS